METAVDSTARARLADFAIRYLHLVRNDASRNRFATRLPESHGGGSYSGVQLTFEEYQELRDILVSGQDEFVVEPIPLQVPDYSLRIYERNDPAPPTLVFTLAAAALPEEVRAFSRKYGESYLVNDAYAELSRFASTEANKALLSTYRLEMSHDISWYED